MRNQRWRDVLRMRARSLLYRRRVERELEKELRFHLDQEIEEACARGLSPDEARSVALRRMGGITQIQEECRDMRRTNFIGAWRKTCIMPYGCSRRIPVSRWLWC